MSKKRLLPVVCVLIVAFIMTLTACDTIKIEYYPPTATEFACEVDDSIPLLTAEDGYVANGSRGFRGETYINLGTDEAYPGSGESYVQRLKDQVQAYSEDGITIVRLMSIWANTAIRTSRKARLNSSRNIFCSSGATV